MKRTNLTEEAKKAKLERDRAKIVAYRSSTTKLLDQYHKDVYTLETLDLTTDVLALNPELYTAWNYRREILLKLIPHTLTKKDALEQDLKLVMHHLKRFPKCYWVWNHRSWCLHQLSLTGEANWAYELAIVSRLLEMDSRNYHGWHYRRYVVSNMERESAAAAASPESERKLLLDLAITEYEYTTSKINKNISNFSAWHNRSKLIPQLYLLYTQVVASNSAGGLSATPTSIDLIFRSPYDILMHELELVKTGMYMDAEDTSVWSYLQWLVLDPLFVDSARLATDHHASTYVQILEGQLKTITELNELEKDDHPDGHDNVWCLKSIIFLKGLLLKENGGVDEASEREIRSMLETLVEIDPLRRGRYLDQIKA